jgi:hypothetical protein
MTEINHGGPALLGPSFTRGGHLNGIENKSFDADASAAYAASDAMITAREVQK